MPIDANGLTNFQAFLAGLVIGIVLPFVFLQIKKALPSIKQHSNQSREQKSGLREKDIEKKLRQHFTRKCQSNHFFSFNCPLNDVYIDNKVVSRYCYTQPVDLFENEPLIYQIFPAISDFPELTVTYPAPQLSFFEVAQSRRNIALMGEIGSGKTSMLSHFCSSLLGPGIPGVDMNETFPLFFHVFELDFDAAGEELFEYIATRLSTEIAGIDHSRVANILSNLYDNDKLIIVIDGLDELIPQEFDSISQRFVQLTQSFPKIQWLTSIGPYYTSNLVDAGFFFYSMSCPSKENRTEIRRKILSALDITSNGISNFEESLLTQWDENDYSNLTPGRILIQILAAYCKGNLSGSSIANTINSFSGDPEILPRLKRIALRTYSGENKPLDSLTVRQMLTDPTDESNGISADRKPQDESSRKTRMGDRSDNLTELIQLGILRKVGKDRIYFSIPLVLCEILSITDEVTINVEPKWNLQNPINDYLLKRSPLNTRYLQQWLMRSHDPVQSIILVNACRHILCKQEVNSAEFADTIHKLLVEPKLPFSLKLKLYFLLKTINNGNVQKILDSISKQTPDRQLLNQLIALSLPHLPAAVRESAFSQVISLSDPIAQLISIIWYLSQKQNRSSAKILELIRSTKDPLPDIVMEILSIYYPSSADLFYELSNSTDISVRKTVVHGLRFINQPWSYELLNKILTEDDQWIVRDAVSHTLESPWNNKLLLPAKREDPTHSSWLLQQASLRGLGIPANQYPEELILDILEKGTLEEKRIALGYLEDFPTRTSLRTLQALSQNFNPLQEDAQSTLTRVFMQKKYFNLLV